jgi:hypothetical protein
VPIDWADAGETILPSSLQMLGWFELVVEPIVCDQWQMAVWTVVAVCALVLTAVEANYAACQGV